MLAPAGSAILAAEPRPEHAEHLLRCLLPLGQTVRLARTAEAALALLRREMFDRAAVAVELATEDGPLLARLSRLPSLQFLVALGPNGDPGPELRARSWGAQSYLVRPVSVEALAAALRARVPAVLGPRPP